MFENNVCMYVCMYVRNHQAFLQ